MNTRVVKIGGSLLDHPQLRERWRRWIEAQPEMLTLLVPGGGRSVDSIRQLDRLHDIGEVPAHWLCVRAMQLHAQLLAAMLPNVRLAARLARVIEDSTTCRVYAIDPWDVLTREEPEALGERLPASWDVTSDSIAARIAHMSSATELVLLKSALPPSKKVGEVASLGYVDACFPLFARGLPGIRCVDLRADDLSESSLTV